MGRHRSDPRGLARILFAALAVVAALTLVIVGGVALINALTSTSSAPPPGTTSPPTSSPTPADTEATASQSSSDPPLRIRVVGPATDVFVRESGNGPVLQRGILATGETRVYEQAPLDVVISDSGSVEVRIYGELQVDSNGGRAQWSVPARPA